VFAARLRAYEPSGDPVGFLPSPAAASVAAPHNDRGSLTLTYNTLAAGGALVEQALESGLEVALEVQDRTAEWVEPRGCRFLHIARDRDRVDPTGTVSLTLPSYGWLLGKARILNGPFYGPEHKQAGKRGFEGKTAGYILVTLLAENETLLGIPLEPVFDAVNDSAGNPWPVLENMAFDEGTTLSAVVDFLVQAGYLDWRTNARGMYAWVPDSPALSPDLSGADGVAIDMAWLTTAPEKETLEGMAHRLVVASDSGGRVTISDLAAPRPWGMWQNFLAVGSVSDQAAAVAVGQADMERTSRAQGQYQRDFAVTDQTPWPLVDFGSGAWITAPGAGGTPERLRTQDINLTLAADGAWSASLILNDRILDADLRRARNLSALTTGGSLSPSGPPSNTDPEASRVPSTPAALDATASLVFDPVTGAPSGVIDVTWDAVTTATDDGPLAISGYELQSRVGAEDWQTVTTPELSARLTGFTPGDEVDTRVRAVGARTILPSAWSGTYSVTVPGDVTAPDIPSVPVVTSRLGVVTTTWDGLSDVGGPMPADFHHLNIAMGETAEPTEVVGTLLRAGSLPVARPYGSTQYVRTQTVDTSGNASAWVPAVEPVIVHGVDAPDLEANSVTTNALQAGSVTGDILAGELLLGSTIKTAESGQRVELSADGFQMFNGAEELLVSFPTDPDESPEIRGVVQADGLTVREGATFFSPLNSFAKDSTISLDESLSAPASAPGATIFWGSLQLEISAKTGALGTFALDPTQIISAAWHPTISQCFVLVQKRSNGTRIWYYDITGAIKTGLTGDAWWDWEDWAWTSVQWGSDGEPRMIGEFMPNGEWYIYQDGLAGSYRKYARANTLREPVLTMNGNSIWVAETLSAGPRFRRMTLPASGTSSTPAVIAEEIVSTGAPSGVLASPNSFYFGNADFGSPRMILSYPGSGDARVYDTAGAYQSAESFPAPTSRAGLIFATSPAPLFFTVGTDGRLWSHSGLTWTSSTQSTWHFGQTFYDANATGGTHETALGVVRSFTMKKRAFVRFTLVEVPFAGGSDDPNRWRLYGMRGTYSAGSMRLQADGPYTQLTVTFATAPTTSGSVAPTTSTFPGGNPARLVSARTLPSNPLQAAIDLRGDGSAVLGPIRISTAGVLTYASDYDTGWLDCTVSSGTTNSQTMQARQIGPVVYLNGRLSRTSSAADQLWFTLPDAISAPRRITTLTPGSNVQDPAFVVVQGDKTVRTPVAMAGNYSLHLTTEYVV
jgi:hypothetical protein